MGLHCFLSICEGDESFIVLNIQTSHKARILEASLQWGVLISRLVFFNLELVLEVSFLTFFEQFDHKEVIIDTRKGRLAHFITDLEVSSMLDKDFNN
jgi:hypothetical protein